MDDSLVLGMLILAALFIGGLLVWKWWQKRESKD